MRSRSVCEVKRHLRAAYRRQFPPAFDRCAEPLEHAGLRAVCHEEWPEDEATISAWQALADRAPFATGFHQPTWQRAVCQTLGKAHRLRLITVWEKGEGGSGGRLLAVLPMSLRDNNLLESLSPNVTDYLDPLIAPDCEVQVWPIVLKLFRALRQGVIKNIRLHHVRNDAPCRGILREMAGSEGFDFAENVTQFAPQLALPASWEEFLATLDAHERKETRRKINKVMTKAKANITRKDFIELFLSPIKQNSPPNFYIIDEELNKAIHLPTYRGKPNRQSPLPNRPQHLLRVCRRAAAPDE
jgi:hypothetical protein